MRDSGGIQMLGRGRCVKYGQLGEQERGTRGRRKGARGEVGWAIKGDQGLGGKELEGTLEGKLDGV